MGRIFPMETPYIAQNKQVVDLKPWKNRHWINGLLIVIMILLFFVFSKWGLAS
ncbi:hypothetical protein H9X96_04355 [Pedobacter sp. N36a]|uniref:hypothetical protein n=1 Tax=Pedobacter sp. N36a TaxID=2767996 RepID=UPI0016570CD7|nr:hypothetical protein [Pedobacter sp. N36a]MBC8985003.1 hypothetical protein [Pedobacter sp. N36a]